MVVGAKCIVLEAADDFLGADGHTVTVGTVGVDVGQHLFPHALLGVVAVAFFLKDDTAFLVDFGTFQGDETRPVVKDEDARVDEVGIGGRHVGQHVDGLLNAGPSVHVFAELHAVVLHIIKECLAGEVGSAVEGHVLQEVGQTALVFLLKDGTHFLRDVEIGALGGFLVVTDVVGQSVFQFASSDVGVEGHGILLGEHGRAQNQRCD